MPDEDSLYSTFATFEPGCMLSELRCLSILTCVGSRGLWAVLPLFCRGDADNFGKQEPSEARRRSGGDKKAEETTALSKQCERMCTRMRMCMRITSAYMRMCMCMHVPSHYRGQFDRNR